MNAFDSSAASSYAELCDDARQTALLASIQGLLEWDDRTKMPPAAGPYRAEQVTWLAGEIHRRRTDKRVGEWLAALADDPLASDASSEMGATVQRMRREYDKKVRLPQALVQEQARLSVRGQQIWADARKADDFERFLPTLADTIRLKREEAAALGYQQSPYDPLLDDYEPGATAAQVGAVLAALGTQLRPLVEEIVAAPHGPDGALLNRHYPLDAQRAFGTAAAAAIGFDFNAGRLDVTDHPFCAGAGPRDIRLTTRYREDDFGDAFFSILHEAGHGLYEQGLPAEHFGLPLGVATSLGIHESQSRMWENQVGRSRGFWEGMFPAAQKAFPAALGSADLETFYRDINRVTPSLIRVDADEVTYNLHIFVRFELERALIEDDLQPADLPAAWRDKYQKAFGIAPADDRDGVLQDVHWSAGLFGYFPTYALGNLYAAQFYEQAQRDLGDLQAAFREGTFAPLCDWLRTHIHAHGSRYLAADLVQRVTGSALSAGPWVAQMRAKYGEVYRL